MKTSTNLFKLIQNSTFRLLRQSLPFDRLWFRDHHQQNRKNATSFSYPYRAMTLVKRYPTGNSRVGKLGQQYKEIGDDSRRNEYEKCDEINEKIKLKNLLQKDRPTLKPGAPYVKPSFQSSEASVNIDFLHSVKGIKRDFVLKVLRKCPKCRGTFSHKSKSEKCKKCDGSGVFMVQSNTRIANRICDLCQGKCVTSKNSCNMCYNKGFIYHNEPVHIAIPAGISNGDIITIKSPNSETPKKTIAVRVNVMNTTKYERRGFDIHSDLPITIPDAILGAKLKVNTIHGTVDLRIPPGVESHSKITLYGKGVRTPKSIGDHIVTLKVDIPKTIGKNVRKLLTSWDFEVKP